MYFFRFPIFTLLLIVVPIGCTGQKSIFDFSSENFLILSNGDKLSANAADYLFDHLCRRILKDSKLRIDRDDEVNNYYKGEIIYVEIVPDLLNDYQIKNEKGKLSIFAKNKKVMLWLSYMLIDRMSNFHNVINVSDLAPTFIDFSNYKGDITMHYKEPYLLPNTDWDYSVLLGTNNVERDWGLWGHNLKNVFTNGIPDSSYAWIHNKRDKEQFCFTSISTFNAIQNFILDEYGDGSEESKWFMIAPNDNKLSCTCSNCLRLGNSSMDSTPAVTKLVNELAKKYPEHFFFTLAYLTTLEPPKVKMKKNTGVFISTIDFPKQAVLNESATDVRQFLKLLNSWKQVTPNIYIWDYISNFDDYLTPYPMLLRLQSQLPFFSENGVNGMFLNGSGYDYSPFDDVKTYAIAALLHNSSLSVENLVFNYFNRFYPTNASILTSYFLNLESRSVQNNIDIPIYLSFLGSQELFFDASSFISLYERLSQSIDKLELEEKNRIKKLLVAWSYTYLQILYSKGTAEGGFLEEDDGKWEISLKAKKLLETLELHNEYSDLKKYKESEGEIETYLKEWEVYLNNSFSFDKRLTNIEVKGGRTNSLIEGGNLLNNFVLGFRSDFNQGWFLAGEDIEVKGTVYGGNQVIKGVVLRFLLNSRHRMFAPEQVEISINNGRYNSIGKSHYKTQDNIVYLEYPIELKSGDELSIKIKKNNQIDRSVIACDEIQLF